MVTKHLKRRLVLDNIDDYMGYCPLELEYYLLESNADYNNDISNERAYGISIVKKVNDKCYEESSVINFSPFAEKTNELIDILADNTVTPISLMPVLDNIL